MCVHAYIRDRDQHASAKDKRKAPIGSDRPHCFPLTALTPHTYSGASPPWMDEYLEGTNFELYVTALPPAVEGMAFHEACTVFCLLHCVLVWYPMALQPATHIYTQHPTPPTTNQYPNRPPYSSTRTPPAASSSWGSRRPSRCVLGSISSHRRSQSTLPTYLRPFTPKRPTNQPHTHAHRNSSPQGSPPPSPRPHASSATPARSIPFPPPPPTRPWTGPRPSHRPPKRPPARPSPPTPPPRPLQTPPPPPTRQ